MTPDLRKLLEDARAWVANCDCTTTGLGDRKEMLARFDAALAVAKVAGQCGACGHPSHHAPTVGPSCSVTTICQCSGEPEPTASDPDLGWVTFVIDGEDVSTPVRRDGRFGPARAWALTQSRNTGRPPEEWEIRDDRGRLIEPERFVWNKFCASPKPAVFCDPRFLLSLAMRGGPCNCESCRLKTKAAAETAAGVGR